MSESYIVVLHDQIPQQSISFPLAHPFLRSRPHPLSLFRKAPLANAETMMIATKVYCQSLFIRTCDFVFSRRDKKKKIKAFFCPSKNPKKKQIFSFLLDKLQSFSLYS
jgi:hypothetical protein